MPSLRLLPLLLTTALTAAAASTAAQAEVIMRIAPVHTDAMIENYNPYNLSGPHAYVQDFAYEPLWIDNVWHPDNDFPALAKSYEIADDLKSVTYHLQERGDVVRRRAVHRRRRGVHLQLRQGASRFSGRLRHL